MKKEAEFDEKIAPLMAKVVEVCKENNIPMFAHFRFDQKSDADQVCCTWALPISEDDKDNDTVTALTKIVTEGWKVIPGIPSE